MIYYRQKIDSFTETFEKCSVIVLLGENYSLLQKDAKKISDALAGKNADGEMRVNKYFNQEINEKRNEIESSKKKIEWGSQIRNYVLHPYKLVKDLRTGTETGNTDSVLNGNIKDFLKSYLMFNTNQSNENLSQS